MPHRWAWLFALIACAWAQTVAPEVLLLARIKRHMGDVLRRQPNYTCLETVERSQRAVKKKRYQLVDVLHLEVAVVDGRELFSWPGEREFKDRDVRELAPNGSFGTGSFAMHARSVFLSDRPLIKYSGEEVMDGRKVARYDYSVPQFQSAFLIRVGSTEAITGYEGSFWNDVETLDLLRLDVLAKDIPPQLPVRSMKDTLRYERAPIGESTFLLPKSSEMELEEIGGTVNRNVIGFSGCRQYAGESKLSFEEAPEGAAAPASPAEPISLPQDVRVEVELRTRIRFPGSAVGDVVEGRVIRDVKKQGRVVVPKGAVLAGNIAYLQRQKNAYGFGYYLLAIQWREIAFDGKTGPFEGQLTDGGVIPVSNLSRSPYLRPTDKEREHLPHRDVFYVRKETLDLLPGLQFVWQTRRKEISGTKKP